MFWYIWDTFGKIGNYRVLDVWSPDTQRTCARRTDDSDRTWTYVQNPTKRSEITLQSKTID